MTFGALQSSFFPPDGTLPTGTPPPFPQEVKQPQGTFPPFPGDSAMLDATTGRALWDGTPPDGTGSKTTPTEPTEDFKQKFMKIFGNVDMRTLAAAGFGTQQTRPPPREEDTRGTDRRQLGPLERHPGFRGGHQRREDRSRSKHRREERPRQQMDGRSRNRKTTRSAHRGDDQRRDDRNGRRRDSR